MNRIFLHSHARPLAFFHHCFAFFHFVHSILHVWAASIGTVLLTLDISMDDNIEVYNTAQTCVEGFHDFVAPSTTVLEVAATDFKF